MSDSRLRELERRWRETGAVEDEVAYLRERIRTGGISVPHVRCAAVLGHRAALIALCEPERADSVDERVAVVASERELSAACLLDWLLEDVMAVLDQPHARARCPEPTLRMATAMRNELRQSTYGDEQDDQSRLALRLQRIVIGVPLVSSVDAKLFDMTQGMAFASASLHERFDFARGVQLAFSATQGLIHELGLQEGNLVVRLIDRLLAHR